MGSRNQCCGCASTNAEKPETATFALPVEAEEVLGSSEEGEEDEEEVEGGDRSSGERTPWLSSSS